MTPRSPSLEAAPARAREKHAAELDHLYETAPVGLCLLDRELRYVRINERLAEINGRSVAEHIGRPFQEVLPEIAPTLEPILRRVLETGEPIVNLDIHGTTPAAPDIERDWLASYYPLKSEEGSVQGISVVVEEITERKHAEDALRETEKHYRALVENSLGLICSHDLDGNFLSVNPAAAQSLGYEPDEMIGVNLAEFLAPSVRHLLPEFLERVRTEGAASGLMRTLSRTGKERFWSYRSTLYRRDRETPYIIGHAVDITEQKTAERALRKAREELERLVAQRTKQLEETSANFRRLVETTNVIPWEADARTWAFTYVGPQAEGILGYPIDRWYEHDFWAEHIHPDDREQALTFCLESSQRYRNYEFEYRMIAADGSVVWLHDLVSVETEKGEPRALRGFMIDITDRKWAEETLQERTQQLRLIADALPVLIAYVDADKRYRFNNLTYEQWFGRSREDLRGMHIFEALGDGTYETIHEHLERALSGQNVEFDTELRFPDGVVRPIHATLAPHTDRDGNVPGVYMLIHDMSERVRAEAALREHREELAHVRRVATMGELAASLAHELNQPLTAIVSNAQAGRRLFARGEADPTELAEVLTDIAEDGKRAGQVIHRLRGLLQRGELERAPLDFNFLVREIVALVNSDAVFRNIRIRLDLAPALPSVPGDRVQLQQVLLNLMMNGLEAITNAGTGAAGELTVKTAASDTDELEVAVQDTGMGIGPDVQGRLFDPFFTTKPEGMGMGLAISRSIVEAHGGRLWATSNSEGGATFHLALPINGDAGAEG